MESITMTRRTEQTAGASAMCSHLTVRVKAGTRISVQGTTVPSFGQLVARRLDSTGAGFGYVVDVVDAVPFKGEVYPLRGVPPV